MTVIDTRVTELTVRLAFPITVPSVARMVVVPAATPVARPVEVMPATVGAVELNVARAVTSAVLESLNIPVAVYCCLVPAATTAGPGVTAIDDNVTGVITRLAVPVLPA